MLKEAVVELKGKILYWIKNLSLRVLFLKLIYFVFGVLMSQGRIFDVYHPFGVSFVASSPHYLFFPAMLGATFGYIFQLNIAMGVRYISTMIAISAMKWALNDLHKIKNHFLFTPILVFIALFITGIAVNFVGEVDESIFVVSVVESLVAAFISYFFEASFKILLNGKKEITIKDFVYLSMSFGILMLAFERATFGGASIGKIFSVIAILIAGTMFGPVGGTLLGASVGIMFDLTSFGYLYTSNAYAFSGMIVGLFSGKNKFITSISFLFSFLITIFWSSNFSDITTEIYETIVGVILFLILPNKIFKYEKLLNFENRYNDLQFSDRKFDLKEIFSQRLMIISKSIECIPNFMEVVTDKFNKSPDDLFIKECRNQIQSICESCSKCGFCYSVNKKETEDNINFYLSEILKNDNMNNDMHKKEFLSNCIKISEIKKQIGSSKERYIKSRIMQTHLKDIKKAAGEQLYGVGSLLKKLSNDMNNSMVYNDSVSGKIVGKLNECGLKIISLVCCENGNHKIFIDMELDRSFRNDVDEKFVEILSKICEKELSEPVITGLGDTIRVQLYEKPNYKFDIEVVQHNCNNGKKCGDSFKHFVDGFGNFNVIISDGMGTGNLAFREGKITSELMKSFVKAGMGFECALKLVNSSLVMKSDDEVLSTLDAVSVDMFNARARFMKAGAPPTYIISGEKIEKIDFSSLPVGILNNAEASHEVYDLCEGDVVIMMSDGAADIGEDWIYEILKDETVNFDVFELSHKLMDKAVELRKSTHDDDITVVAFKILKK